MAAQDRYDIVIVGAGPAGLVLSTCLARWGYKVKHVDNRAEPTPTGRADGIQPRSLDFLRNMNLKRQIMAHEPAKVYEVAFWDPSSEGDLAKSGVSIQRPWTMAEFENDGQDPSYPVRVELVKIGDANRRESVRTKYLFSGEGARSSIREKLGIKVKHKDPIAHVWGVMDGVVRTDFPDIKMKCTIHSDAGSIMVIPREANMVRLYIQMASSTDKDWNPRRTATAEEVQAHAKRILSPYKLEWDRVEWFSVYPIGQGISERYTLDERVFLGGDACHTHSPKAGQGMNAAFLDAQNLAWKIHHVERGFASRDTLKTYESERKHIAENLLDFDARYAKLFSTRIPAADEVAATNSDQPVEENEFVKVFKESCEFTSGYGVAYQNNVFNWSIDAHPARHPCLLSQDAGHRQTRLRTGRILCPATVTRVVDANVVHLEQEIPLNGSWRIYVFAGQPASPSRPNAALVDFARHSAAPTSYLGAYMYPEDVLRQVSPHERHNPHSAMFSFCVVFAARHAEVSIVAQLPPLLARYADHVYADDVPDERVAGEPAAAHAKMGLGAADGGVVVVRPDGYVGCVARLVEGAGTVDAMNAYFSAFCGKSLGRDGARTGEGDEQRAML